MTSMSELYFATHFLGASDVLGSSVASRRSKLTAHRNARAKTSVHSTGGMRIEW